MRILGLSKGNWKESGDCYSEGFRFMGVGGGRGQRAITLVLDPEIAKHMTSVAHECGDRIEKVKIEDFG